MGHLKVTWKRLQKDERGQSLVEFGLIVACVAIVGLAGLRVLGGEAIELFNDVTEMLS